MAGFIGDPLFATGTSGWTTLGSVTLQRAVDPSVVPDPAELRWSNGAASGLFRGTANSGYAGTEIRITMDGLTTGQWYYVQAYQLILPSDSPRLQMYCTTEYGTYSSNVAPSGVTGWHVISMIFAASASTATLRFINFDPVVTSGTTAVNGLLITPHATDPTLRVSMDGWSTQAQMKLLVRDGRDLGTALYGTLPKDSTGAPYPHGRLTAEASHALGTRAAVYSATGFTVGKNYQVLVRTVNQPGGFPIYLGVDDTQISWASDHVLDDWVVKWGTFTATATSHQVKIINGAPITAGQTATFAGLEIKEVPTLVGEPLSTTSPPHYPAKIQQTLYPCQPGWHDATVRELVTQFRHMKDVGINQLVMEQVINMGERRAYYDTGLKTSKTVTEPVSGQPFTIVPIPVHNDLVDRIIEAKETVGGIDLWWGIGRYWPWENTPVTGAGVTSTTDPGVSWTSASWTTDQWGDHAHEHGSSAEALASNAFIVDEVVSRYGPHIDGWYLPLEVESVGATWQPNHPWFRTLFYEMAKMCLAAKSGVPVMVSPFYQDLVTYPPVHPNDFDVKKKYAEAIVHCYLPAAKHSMANGATKFILAQQDGLGDVDRSIEGSARIYHAIDRARRLSDFPADDPIELWHNIDLYDVHYNAGGPMDPQKLQDMMNAVNLLPARTSFAFASQLTPQRPTRRPAWAAYRHYATGRGAAFAGVPPLPENISPA